MIAREACAHAHVELAGCADVVGAGPLCRLLAAHNAVSCLRRQHREMSVGQRSMLGRARRMASWPALRRKALHELMSERQAELQVALRDAALATV